MKKLCIAQCGQKKIWKKIPDAGPTPARRVYIGPFAGKCIKYAETFYPNDYLILSAKYGFLLPDDIVPADYNVSFNNPDSNLISTEELKEQARLMQLFRYSEIIAVVSSEYLLRIRAVFTDVRVHAPLSRYHGIFQMIAALNQAIVGGLSFSLDDSEDI